MYSLSCLRRQADALQRRLKPVLTILRLRNLAVQFCDEFDEAASAEPSPSYESLRGICMMFPHRVARTGYRLGRGKELVSYFLDCVSHGAGPEPREVVFTLIPWARKGPLLRPDLWDRPDPTA